MNDSALISTAVLTAIWDEQHKDNIELIKPFIISIIHKKYIIGEIIDEDYIIRELKEKYYFNNFPHAVLTIILKRMKKGNLLKAINRKFMLISDLSKESEEFDTRLKTSRTEIFEVISRMKDYLSNELGKAVSFEQTEQFFSDFISTYGYNTYGNISYTRTIDRRADETNYIIGEFICNESKNNSSVFSIILKMIEGCMIANAIYLQIDNNNKSSLKRLNCYLDSPFIVRVFGYKTKEENDSAKELYDLLKKYDAKLYCFEHTYREVKGILEYYQKNINNVNKESTLEYFDEQKYTEGQVDNILTSLEDTFKEYQIHRVETPEYNDESLHKYVIDIDALKEKLRRHKELNNNYYSDSTITNDVNSVNAISILRKGKKATRIEDCNHIFLTTYYYLKIATNEVLNEKTDTDIGLVIDDLDLTTILWLKDFENNSELPKMRLIENAIAATNASDEILKKTQDIFCSIKKDKIIKNIDNVSAILTKRYLKSCGYIDSIKNNPELVTKENLVDFITRSSEEKEKTEKELCKTKLEFEHKLKTEKQDNKKEIEMINKANIEREEGIKQRFIDDLEKKAKKYDKYEDFIIIIYRVFVISMMILLIFFTIRNFKQNPIWLLTGVFLILDILSITDTLVPRLRLIERKLRTLLKNKKSVFLANGYSDIENKFKK